MHTQVFWEQTKVGVRMSLEAKDQEKLDPSDEMEQEQEQTEDVAATQQGPVGRFQTARQAVEDHSIG